MSNFKRFLIGRKSVINSETAPEDKTAIWIKNNSIKAYGNKGWKSLKSGSDEGGGGDSRGDYSAAGIIKGVFNEPVIYPIELSEVEQESSTNYFYGLSNCSCNNLGTSTIYVIGKYNSGIPTIPNYKLLATYDLSEEHALSIGTRNDADSVENGPYTQESWYEVRINHFGSGSCVGSCGWWGGNDIEFGEYSYLSVELIKQFALSNEDFPDSVILDTEYNTTKYPERIHQEAEF